MSCDLTNVKAELKCLEAAVVSGSFEDILEADGDLRKAIAEATRAKLSAPKSAAAVPATAAADVAECTDICKRIDAACTTVAAKPPKAAAGSPAPVGALWDGALLKQFLALIGPFVLNWLSEWLKS